MKRGDTVKLLPTVDNLSLAGRIGQPATFLNAQGKDVVQIEFSDNVRELVYRKDIVRITENSSEELSKALRIIETVIEGSTVRSLQELLLEMNNRRISACERERQKFLTSARNCESLVSARWHGRQQKLSKKPASGKLKKAAAPTEFEVKVARAQLEQLGVDLNF